ncbi:MAG: restriction endonuclease subunit S, partial [bacterium]|nr:restriction endonuclease subunit S [bacterium]
MTAQTIKNWKKMRFVDFVDTNPRSVLKKDQEYPFIPMELVDGVSKYPATYFKKKFTGGGSRFMDGDTIFARITPCLENGKIAQVKNLPGEIGFGSTEFFVFRNKDGISDKDFIYYLSRTDEVRSPAIKSMVGASGRQRADKSVVENLEVLVPSISDQRQIADVLSVYDDLIYNNTRRIKILEQMAQAIYTEWFVNFRFPGHRKVRMVDSGTDFGKIPEGWSIGKLSDLANITMGQSPSSVFYNESGEGSPFHQGVTNFDFRFPTTTTFSTGGTRRASAGDILFSVRA